MNDFLNFVENKVKENIKVESITVIDNSALHKKHKFFNSNKYHLCLEIRSSYLNSLNRVKAHRKITKLLSEEIISRIHALEIKIK
tara:strand:+ start:359 stop:613 length:255 start_codon:yes stop_codon:yes gene_type:complete